MSALLKTLTFNGLQQKSFLSGRGANHELFYHITSKWDIPEEGTFSTVGTCSGIDHCVYLKTSKDGSSPDRLDFDSSRDSFQKFDRILVALRIRSEEVFLNQYKHKTGDRESVWRAMDGLKEQQSKEKVQEPYLDTLPQELVDSLSAPETGDPALLEELSKFVEDNRVFKEDMLALLNYLASDQCVHGYDDLVAGYEA
ncbi:hypothetical protein BGZ74_011069 [Mortierella antarctica]|nr:hypothetical protein BGZ74_011069 [Mortierella antarctica]